MGQYPPQRQLCAPPALRKHEQYCVTSPVLCSQSQTKQHTSNVSHSMKLKKNSQLLICKMLNVFVTLSLSVPVVYSCSGRITGQHLLESILKKNLQWDIRHFCFGIYLNFRYNYFMIYPKLRSGIKNHLAGLLLHKQFFAFFHNKYLLGLFICKQITSRT